MFNDRVYLLSRDVTLFRKKYPGRAEFGLWFDTYVRLLRILPVNLFVASMDCTEYTSDHQYVSDIRKGGHAQDRALECLYRSHRQAVVNIIRAYLRNRTRAQEDTLDAIQDAFLIMIEKIRDGGYNQGSLIHFWAGITKGLLRNKIKRDARTDLTDDSTDFDQTDNTSPDFILMDTEQKERLGQILDQLGPRCKKTLLLWAGGYSMEEIANILSFSSEAMARKTKYRCKNQLMELIGKMELDLG